MKYRAQLRESLHRRIRARTFVLLEDRLLSHRLAVRKRGSFKLQRHDLLVEFAFSLSLQSIRMAAVRELVLILAADAVLSINLFGSKPHAHVNLRDVVEHP